ncbi:MAG: leucine-rich repeat domain-containing protein [Bacteroidales bacterium]|nr:leucine-rich repeat domain-containing protein [Bacteroidales bacterium]
MKKIILSLIITVSTMLSTAWAYDFSVVVSSGQTLYFNINSNSTSNEVYVTYPNSNAQYMDEYYNGYTTTTGNLIIPTSVTYNGITYSVTSIGDNAFYICRGLTWVTIPNSVTTIGISAFDDCRGLTSVTIPSSVTSIGSSAFRSCRSLTTLTFNAINCNNFGSTGYPFGVCPISTIVIGDSVQHIPTDFSYGNSYLTSLTIGNSVSSIGDNAFRNCSGLTSVTIPNSVANIGSNAFYRCSGLTTLIFNAINCNDFNSRYDHAFDDCPISAIVIGDSVQRIPAYFAYNNSSLISVIIPNSVSFIGDNAFYGCTSIGRIDVKSVTPPTISSNSFYRVSSSIPVYIPCGSLSNYSNSAWSSQFSNLQETQVFSLGVAVNDSTMGMALILSNTCANTAIQAYPYDGYHFVSWNDGNTDNPRTIVLNQDTTFIASFMQQYRVEVLSGNDTMGTVTGSGFFNPGSEVTISATPMEGYKFIGWNDGCMDNPRTIVVTGNSTFTANFTEKMKYTITVNSEDQTMGLVTGGGVFYEQTIISIVATPRTNYHFKEWSDGDTNKVRSIMVVCDSILIARFERNVSINNIDNLETLEFYPNPTSGIITFNHTDIQTDIQKVEVLDAMGKIVMLYENTHIIDLSKLSKGYYTMCITTSKGVTVRKVIRK